MCLSPDAYVFALMYERLTAKGVSEQKAKAVAMKVARRYELRRRESAGRAQTSSQSVDA